MSAHEQRAEADPDSDGRQRQPHDAVLHRKLEPIDHRQNGGERERSAAEVQPLRGRRAGLGQENRTDDEQEHHDGNAE